MRHFKRTAQIFLLASIGLAWACASGLKAYQSGDYFRACGEAIERLRSNPDNHKAREALLLAYPQTVAYTQRQVDNDAANRTTASLENTIALYDRMNQLGDDIARCPAAQQVIPQPRDYRSQMREAMDLAGQIYYRQGLQYMEANTMEGARRAYDCFKRTAHYTPGYQDVDNLLARSRYEGTLRVIVTRPQTNPAYQLDAEFFYDKLMNRISTAAYSNLVRFYTPQEAAAEAMNTPHQLLVLDFTDFTVGNVRSTTNTSEMKRDSVVVGTTTINGTSHKVYGTVKAKYTLNRIEILSRGTLSVRIADPQSGRVYNRKSFTSESVWFSEWASYNGDERALTNTQIATTKQRRLAPPPPQELFVSFANPMYARAAEFIASAYSR